MQEERSPTAADERQGLQSLVCVVEGCKASMRRALKTQREQKQVGSCRQENAPRKQKQPPQNATGPPLLNRAVIKECQGVVQSSELCHEFPHIHKFPPQTIGDNCPEILCHFSQLRSDVWGLSLEGRQGVIEGIELRHEVLHIPCLFCILAILFLTTLQACVGCLQVTSPVTKHKFFWCLCNAFWPKFSRYIRKRPARSCNQYTTDQLCLTNTN